MVLCIGGEATQQNGPTLWLYARFSFSPSQESHWESVMCLVMNAFAPHNNNVERGGRAYKKVDCVRIAGRMVKAKKDSYHRVYRNDGT
jgi:hypothetical protein